MNCEGAMYLVVAVGALARLTRTTDPDSSPDHAVWTGDGAWRSGSSPTTALHDTVLERGTATLRKMKLAWLIEARATRGEKRDGDVPALANARPLTLPTTSTADRTRRTDSPSADAARALP
jgi:hypothetical protein